MVDLSQASRDPNAWERHICTLLRYRYGPVNVANVPAKHQGDVGLDAFSFCGHAYQCYAPEEPLSTADRYEKHRDKMTRDIGKFIDRKDKILSIVGNVVFDRWVLVVPLCDSKELLAHAATKAEEVRQRNLPYVSPSFQVAVNDIDAFQDEESRAVKSGLKPLQVSGLQPAPGAVEAWSGQYNQWVDNLLRKLRKLHPNLPEAEIGKKAEQFITTFLTGENALDELRIAFPDIWEEVNSGLRNREERLEFLGSGSGGTPAHVLREEYVGLEGEISASIPNLQKPAVGLIARRTLADWLLRCPLDFP